MIMARKARRRRLAQDEVPSGTTIHVGLELMDGWQRAVHDHFHNIPVINTGLRHAPGYIDSSSAAVRDAKRKAVQSRDAWLARQSSAWRSTAAPLLPTPTNVADRAKAIAAREAKIQQMRDAWRKPFTAAFRDGPQPDTSNLEPPDDDDANGDNGQDARERQYQARCESLQNAWRSPGVTNPSAATAIEQQAEQWRGGR
jgi:hypothetical protein